MPRPGCRARPGRLNSEVPGHELRTRWLVAPGALAAAERDMERGLLTARGLDRVLRVAWTDRGPRGTGPAARRWMSTWPWSCVPGDRARGAHDRSDAREGPDAGRWASAGRSGGGERERLARAALTRVIEPGDEHGGRWLREFGARGLMARLTAPEHEEAGLTGATAQAARGLPDTGCGGPTPTATWRRWPRSVAGSSARGTRNGRPSSTTSGTPARSDSGCGDGPTCGNGHCARSPSSGPGPARRTGRTWRPPSARGSPSGAGSWCRGRPTGSTARRTGAHSPRAGPPSPYSPAGWTSSIRAGMPN